MKPLDTQSYCNIYIYIYLYLIRPYAAIQIYSSTSPLMTHFARKLVMMFKRQRQENTAMPENTAIPMFLTGCETEMHIWKYG